MKQIVLVLGIGLNERGWAKDFSKFGRVTLIQLGLVEHVEIWENENRVFCGPETRVPASHKWDERLMGLIGWFRTMQLILRLTKGKKVDLVVTGFYSSNYAALCLRL